MSSFNTEREARLPSFQTTGLDVLLAATLEAPLPLLANAFPLEESPHGQCQAPALPDDAERLSAIIATQQEIATAGLDLGTVMTLVADRTQALTGAAGAAVVWAEGDEMVYTSRG
jgi:hypothetical protein